MRILHLTDFHFSSDPKHAHDQNTICNALVKELTNEKIDFVFFTGDLVFKGEKYQDFLYAKELLLDKIASVLGLEKGRIFICAGNHDVHRNQELIDTTDKIKEINDSNKLEEFLKRQDGKSFEESLKNFDNYNKFQEEFYKEYGISDKDSLNNLFTVHKRVIKNTKIGIVTINSAWRAIESKNDRGNLLYPISLLKKAIEDGLKETDFRIFLMHHPISDFKDWNASEMEDLIYKDFHMLFSGHLHKKKQSIQICTEEGVFCCSASASLALDGSQNGYSTIDIDLESYDIEIKNSFYIKQEGIFTHPSELQKITLPVGKEKGDANDFRRKLRKKYNEELSNANELFISYDDKSSGKGFNELYTDPILKPKTKTEIADKQKDSPVFNLSEILSKNENIVTYGKDKSGKTSILYKAMLDCFNDFAIYRTIPLYINSKDYKNSHKQLDIYKYIGFYFEINQAKAKSLPEKYPVRLLIDNFDPHFTSFNNVINSFLENHKSSSFIATTEERLSASFTLYEFDGRTYKNLYIHEISRPEVRLLANKWPNLTPEKREIILDKIFSIFTQLSIPINYWTVSMFIWIFEKNGDANFHSSFELIQLYIDNLLDKQRLALDKSSKLKFEDFKEYLSELANFLLKKHENGYTATYSEITTFTQEYRQRNRRFVIEVRDIVELIINKNILKLVNEDGYTFRLNGVFEYFIALYMTLDEKFRKAVIEDDHFYLSFKNELELFAGFEKNNQEYVVSIYEKTQRLFKTLHESYSANSIDTQLLLKIQEVYDITIPIKQLGQDYSKALPVEKQDELLNDFKPLVINDSEVKVKDYNEEIVENAENLEKVLYILARVFRNSNIKDHQLQNQIFDYILNSVCYLGFKLIDEAEVEDYGLVADGLSEEEENILVRILTNFMPVIVQTFLYDALAQNDLERIFQEKIEDLKKDSKNNQFKLLILYLTLIDLDVNANKNLIKELIEIIDIGFLQQTTILKLYYYLMFKANNKPHLEEFIKSQIQAQTKKIAPDTDMGQIQKGLEKTSRILRLKKNNNKQKGI